MGKVRKYKYPGRSAFLRLAGNAATSYLHNKAKGYLRNARGNNKKFGFRFKSRGRGSRTKTTTRRRRGGTNASSISGVTSYVRLSLLGRKQRFLSRIQYAMATKARYELLNKIRLSGGQNQQSTTWLTMFPTDELLACCAQVTDSLSAEGFNLYIRSCKLRMQIVNVQNIMTTIWIYECVLRRDISEGGIDAVNDWKGGIDLEGGSSTDYTTPYATPFTSKRFCLKWKVAKVTRSLVAPGETHVHYVNGVVNHKLSSGRLYTAAGSNATGEDGIGGLTVCVVVVALGGVWNDQINKSDIGYSPTALDIAYTKKYDVMGTVEDKKYYTVQNNLATVTTGQLLEEVDASPEPLKVA